MTIKNHSLVLIVFLIIYLLGMNVFSQPPDQLSTNNRRAERAFNAAMQSLDMRDLNTAMMHFQEAISHDPNFVEVFIITGEIFQSMQRYEEAAAAFKRAVEINPGFFPNARFYLAETQYLTGKYIEAYENIQLFLEYENLSQNIQVRANDLYARVSFASHAYQNPVPFEPINLGENINSRFDEYAPTLTADEQTLIFTRKKPRQRQDADFTFLGGDDEYEDFYVSYRENGEWTRAVNLGPPINTNQNEGAQTISADGQHLFFTACQRPGGKGSCDIYYAYRIGSRWSEPENIGFPINTPSWESQPSISADGKTLYFVSNRQGNYGRMDIWKSKKTDNGNWTLPQNLGDVINTKGREMSPFIHPDNTTLYFASDGHPGMGGMDLFYSRRDSEGNWQEPVNLGYPINTMADEFSLIVGASGTEAYFASEMEGGVGRSDLYFFELYDDARPAPVTYMKGIVFDQNDLSRLDADFTLIDVNSGETLVLSQSDATTGEFLIPIPVGKNLALNVSKKGYLFFSENFAYHDVRTSVDPHLFDIPLQQIRAGESVVLRNIFFKTASHELMPESITELNRLLSFLTQNPSLKIEISGHTDNVGNYDYNMNLSQNRARSVYNFLREKGIDSKRMTYKGYADTKPIAPNDTEEGRAKNRRTEFTVVGN